MKDIIVNYKKKKNGNPIVDNTITGNQPPRSQAPNLGTSGSQAKQLFH